MKYPFIIIIFSAFGLLFDIKAAFLCGLLGVLYCLWTHTVLTGCVVPVRIRHAKDKASS